MLPKLYLIGKKHEDIQNRISQQQSDNTFRSFLVHKIKDIEISVQPNFVPDDFQIKTYLAAGNMDVLLDHSDSSQHELVLELSTTQYSNLISDLKESPISTSQSLTQLNNTTWHLKAEVKRTIQLKNWLLSLGFQAKIISPSIIRDDLIQALDAMRKNYL